MPQFPSPYGDVVLKLLRTPYAERRTQLVSVPLRGCSFEIARELYVCESIFNVSVPLRGCSFEIMQQQHQKQGILKVSVPLRGCSFEIMVLAERRLVYMRFRPLAGM